MIPDNQNIEFNATWDISQILYIALTVGRPMTEIEASAFITKHTNFIKTILNDVSDSIVSNLLRGK